MAPVLALFRGIGWIPRDLSSESPIVRFGVFVLVPPGISWRLQQSGV